MRKRAKTPHRDIKVRWGASDALGKIGASAITALTDALRHGAHDLKREAAYALGRIGLPALDALEEALKDSDWSTREYAALALAWLGEAHRIVSVRAVHMLVAALADEAEVVRNAAADALYRTAVENQVYIFPDARCEPAPDGEKGRFINHVE